MDNRAKQIISHLCESLPYCTLPFKAVKSDETWVSEDLEDSRETYSGTPN